MLKKNQNGGGNLLMNEFNDLYLKANVLCLGLRANEYSMQLASKYSPTSTKRTGLVGIHFKIGKYVVNGSMDKIYENKGIYTNRSPFELKNENEWALYYNGHMIRSVELIPTPKWYNSYTKNGVQMTKLFLEVMMVMFMH